MLCSFVCFLYKYAISRSLVLQCFKVLYSVVKGFTVLYNVLHSVAPGCKLRARIKTDTPRNISHLKLIRVLESFTVSLIWPYNNNEVILHMGDFTQGGN